MDKGAHFYRCDFQVHSPRDEQWTGANAVTDDERKVYARELIAACRAKDLQAIAITDHHDLAFVDFVRAEAANEADETGTLLPPAQRLIVFPGMELTLGVPCQALLLFDAHFPKDLFTLARHALALPPYPDDSSKGPQVVRLDGITDLRDLYKKLNEHEYLRKRFILFPNVSEGGNSTLLRSGHAGHYSNMPCIGGYLDGSVTQLGNGNKRILSGGDANYGSKALAIFQTSDNRKRTHVDLGAHTTWVKWATPSAEALRQACLAKESRISQEAPFVPSVVLTSVTVSQSKFLGPIHVELNPQYNALIGGRGTGKSTILEYIRWALYDEPVQLPDDLEATDYRKRRINLVEGTLTSMGADVTIDFLVNGAHHSVRRLASTNRPLLQIGSGDYQPASEDHIRTILPIQAYSQKQLSSVGVRVEELKRFVTAPIRQHLEDISTDFADLAKQMHSTYGHVARRRQAERDLTRTKRELDSLNQQILTTRASLKGLSQEDQDLLATKPHYDTEEQLFGDWQAEIQSSLDLLDQLSQSTPQYPTPLPDESAALPNLPLLTESFNTLNDLLRSLEQEVTKIRATLTQATSNDGSLAKPFAQWQEIHTAFQAAYLEAQGRSSAHQSLLKQLAELEARAKALRDRIAQLTRTINETAAVDQEFQTQITNWKALHLRRAELIKAEADKLTQLSGGSIRARLQVNVGTKAIEDKFRSLITGTGIRTQKVEELVASISSAEAPLERWFALLTEFEALAYAELPDGQIPSLPDTPHLSQIFTGNSDRTKLASRISPENWPELVTLQLEDEPIFEYQARPNDYKPFASTSAGQQATALLTALLNQQGPPLLIDQPEDDLDVGSTPGIVDHIWRAKGKRQLIFASHNANLVVNGDAELVICCDYRVPGQQATGQIKCEGAIDIREVRDEITRVMEGGEAAFKLRKEKYGF